jgi:hypothetical protein
MQEGESKATAIASEREPKIRIWLCVRIRGWKLDAEKELGWNGNYVCVTVVPIFSVCNAQQSS